MRFEIPMICFHYVNVSVLIQFSLKPLSHWDATSSRWVWESIAKPLRTIAKCSNGIAKFSHASRTRRDRFTKDLNM